MNSVLDAMWCYSVVISTISMVVVLRRHVVSDFKSLDSVFSQDSLETHFGCLVLVLWVGVLVLWVGVSVLVLTSLS